MLFDLGVNVVPNMTLSVVYSAIEMLDSQFDKVIIAEKLEESLILLKEKFCWRFVDIVYLTKNARKAHRKKIIGDQIARKLRLLNSGDTLLYNFFVAKHERAVQEFGRERMNQEIELLRSHVEHFTQKCNINVEDSFKYDSKKFKGSLNIYKVTKNSPLECQLLSVSEFDLLGRIERQFVTKLK